MASVYKRGRWVDASGRKCPKDRPGARYVESRFYTVAVLVNGRIKPFKGYSDKAASEQLGAKLERAKSRGEQDMVDPYKEHRGRRLLEHVADWIAELRQLGRDDVYVGFCESRMGRLISECKWETLGTIGPDSFIRWRETATSTVGHAAKPGGARTQNHYLETARAFCLWAVKRKRMASNPLADVAGVETVGQLRRERRALTEEELAALLVAVPERHKLAYRMIFGTGLRRDELRQLRWGDVKLNAPMPHIQLRAETTKGKRADALPLRQDLAELLRTARGDAEDGDRVFRTLPSMDSHKRYLIKANIGYTDDRGRRADFHALRHTYGSLLAKAGVAPRVAMTLMRHTDMRLTMNVYTDPRIFDLAGAVEKLPAISTPAAGPVEAVMATGTDGAGWCESGTSSSAEIGNCSAVNGEDVNQERRAAKPCH
jgi:integrase